MDYNRHFRLRDKHAFLSASKYAWVNYDLEKLDIAYERDLAKRRGTRLHNLASELIILGIKLPRSKKTLNMYVNDAIGFKMESELILRYSDNCFGTADSLSFRKNLLRIHDYKSGTTPAKHVQLEIYAALFCLEYDVHPNDITIELAIYQFNERIVEYPEPERIMYIAGKIKEFDKRIDQLKRGE